MPQGAPLGLHHSQATWVRPCGMYPFTSLAYSVGSAPRAASSPSRSGLTQWRASFLHLPELVCFSRIIYLWLSPTWLSPTTGAVHAGTALVLGSVPATSINLSGRALTRGTPRARHLNRTSVPSFSNGATSGWLAIIMAFCAPPRADLQEPPEDNSRRYHGLLLLPCDSLAH